MNVTNFEKLLTDSGFDKIKSRKLITGFRQGFEIGYHGDRHTTLMSNNLPFSIGSKVDLWNKVMKEVKLNRYAGPFKNPPFDNFIQSPIGLVPKDAGKDMRLIFHLSHPRIPHDQKPLSVNGNTIEKECSVSYPDFSDAIRLCMLFKHGFAAKSDFKSAFRNLGMCKEDWPLLVMKAVNPIDHKTYFFVDKCLPFGGSISCAHFQLFSDAVAHIFTFKTGKQVINYLDDFFLVDQTEKACNEQVSEFLKICEFIGFPVSMEKTFWATKRITFLGILIDLVNEQVYIPLEKIEKAKYLITRFTLKRKATISELQRLCGLLNFFTKCIIPARTFTRRLYSKLSGYNLKPNHHVPIDPEIELDLLMWLKFLDSSQSYSRNFADFSKISTAKDIQFYTDSSGAIGCGGYCGKEWFSACWDQTFLSEEKPSIEYLELFAVTVGILNWIKLFTGQHIYLFCDNESVVKMINNKASSCRNCMVLLRIIVLEGIKQNVKINAKHVRGKDNTISDWLSRRKFKELNKNKKFSTFQKWSTPIPTQIWPISKIWLK